jgi:hypothetical protein
MRRDDICQYRWVFRQRLYRTFRSWRLRVCHEHRPQAQWPVCPPAGHFAENPDSRSTCVPRVKKRGITESSHLDDSFRTRRYGCKTYSRIFHCNESGTRSEGGRAKNPRLCAEDACSSRGEPLTSKWGDFYKRWARVWAPDYYQGVHKVWPHPYVFEA